MTKELVGQHTKGFDIDFIEELLGLIVCQRQCDRHISTDDGGTVEIGRQVEVDLWRRDEIKIFGRYFERRAALHCVDIQRQCCRPRAQRLNRISERGRFPLLQCRKHKRKRTVLYVDLLGRHHKLGINTLQSLPAVVFDFSGDFHRLTDIGEAFMGCQFRHDFRLQINDLVFVRPGQGIVAGGQAHVIGAIISIGMNRICICGRLAVTEIPAIGHGLSERMERLVLEQDTPPFPCVGKFGHRWQVTHVTINRHIDFCRLTVSATIITIFRLVYSYPDLCPGRSIQAVGTGSRKINGAIQICRAPFAPCRAWHIGWPAINVCTKVTFRINAIRAEKRVRV